MIRNILQAQINGTKIIRGFIKFSNNSSCFKQNNGLLHLSKHFTTTSNNKKEEERKTLTQKSNEKRIALTGYYNIKKRNKDTFLATIDLYKENEKHLRGYVEFIYASLSHMKEFGVERELEVYKKLLDIMPKDKMITRNMFQAMFMHYPRQQQCAIDVLEQMERNKVCGDSEVHQILLNTFGVDSHPVKKFRRMLYWFPKFKNASPWNLPDPITDDAFELAKLAVKRMCSVDPASKITILQTSGIVDSIDDTWIVNGQSKDQKELLLKHPKDIPVKVEGPFRIYLRTNQVTYFILRTDYVPPDPTPHDPDDIKSFVTFFGDDEENPTSDVAIPLSVHQQEDGVIYALCATGTSSRDSTLSWIRLLEKENPVLSDLTILFEQTSPIGEVLELDKSKDENLPEKAS